MTTNYSYFNSLNGEYIIDVDPTRRIINEARINLSRITSQGIKVEDFSKRRSMFRDSVAGFDIFLEGQRNKFLEIDFERFDSEVASLRQVDLEYPNYLRKKYTNEGEDPEDTPSPEEEEDIEESVDFVKGVLDYLLGLVNSAAELGSGVIKFLSENLEGIIDFTVFNLLVPFVASKLLGVLAFPVLLFGYFPFIAFIKQGTTDFLAAIGDWFDNTFKPAFADAMASIERTINEIYTSLILPTIETVFNYFESGQAGVDYDRYILDNIRMLSASITENGIPSTLLNIARGLREGGENILNYAGNLLNDAWEGIKGWDWFGSDFVESAGNFVGESAKNIFTFISNFITSSEVQNTIAVIGEFLNTLIPDYKDGVSETRYGLAMERSWSVFLSSLDSINVNFLTTTPLDPRGNGTSSLYGNMMLGTPLTYTNITDPNNRVLINTFVKDSVFLSLTPGMPKYNGGNLEQEIRSGVSSFFSADGIKTSGYLTQTPEAQDMVNYLLKNGVDISNWEKDKRYYKFEAKYEDYFAYLETMLNTVWIKMGLATTPENKLNIYSFFNPADGDFKTLNSAFKSSIGFFVNYPAGISETISSSPLHTDLGGEANAASDSYQRLNYITGMGTGGSLRDRTRQLGVGIQQAGDVTNLIATSFNTGGQSFFKNPIKAAINLGKSIMDFSNTQDISALMQQFAVTNGMRVQYPYLWQESNYTKNVLFDFNFVSPYGDPLSIFQYVYVPFLSLLAFAMPRQAAENGLVSPFFVRADIPGLFTSDLALITDVTWQKGGPDSSLWTKDRLPRSISGSFTVTDLYPFLSMVKRISFMSANPSFTVFLDNMAGLRAIYNNEEDDPYNTYWKKMINRVTGLEADSNLWNEFSRDSKFVNSNYANTNRESLTKTINKKAAPWLSKI